MNYDSKISAFEGFSMMTLSFMFYACDRTLPELITKTGGAGWIAQTLNCALAFLVFALYMSLMRKFDGKDFVQICYEVLGKFVARLIFIILFVFFFTFICMMVSKLVNVLNIFSYPMARTLLMIASFVGVMAAAAYYPFTGLARVSSICLPIAMLALFVILAVASTQYDVSLLTPILGYGVTPILKSAFQSFSFYNMFLMFPLFARYFGSTETFGKVGFASVAAASVSSVIVTLCYNMATPYHSVQYEFSGLLELAQSRYINRFFQRFEAFFLLIYLIGLLALFSIGMFTLKILYANIFNLKPEHEKKILLPTAVSLTCVSQAMLYFSAETEALRQILNNFSLAFAVGLVLLILLVAAMRKKGARRIARAAGMLLFLCVIAGVFSGCQPYREPDEEITALIIGYDKGETERYKITAKFMSDSEKSQSGGDSKSGESSGDVFTADAPSLIAMADILNTVIPKHISLHHTNVLVISEEVAREGVDAIVTPLVNFSETKSNMSLIICKDSAEEYIRSEGVKLFSSLPMKVEMLMQYRGGTSAYELKTAAEFYKDYRGDGGATAIYSALDQQKKQEKEKNKDESPQSESQDKGGLDGNGLPVNPGKRTFIEGFNAGELPISGEFGVGLAGMAVFSGDKMVGTLNTRETASLSMLQGQLQGSSYVVKDIFDSQYSITFSAFSRNKPRIRTRLDENGNAHIDIHVDIKLQTLISQNGSVDYTVNENRKLLVDYTRGKVEDDLRALIHKSQNELDSDILQLGRHVSCHFTTIGDWENYDWRSRYKDAEINVECQLMIQ